MLTALICCLCFCAQDRAADTKERIAELRKEIADLRERIAEREADIIRLSPPKKVTHIFATEARPGQLGPFGARFTDAGGNVGTMTASIRVEKIIDGKTMLVSVLSKQKPILGQIKFDPSPKQVIVGNCDTSKILPGATHISRPFLALGSRVVDGVSYLHVEPYTPAGK